MRVLITGSRTWTDFETITTALAELGENHVLISGNCPQGADLMCEKAAEKLGWALELYPADWDKFGKSAGFIRNEIMVNKSPDICLAFIHNKSKGATGTVNLSKKAEIPTMVYRRDDYVNHGALSVKSYNVMEQPEETPPEDFLF